MAHSLETRLPFLDNDLVDFSQKIPIHLKLNNIKAMARINGDDIGGGKKTNDGKVIFGSTVYLENLDNGEKINYKIADFFSASKISHLTKKKFKIILFTSRFMGRNNDDTIKAKKMGYEFTKNQLRKWGLDYHKLVMGKPSYDLFIDDKCLFFKSEWAKILKKKLMKIIQ